MFLTKQAMMGIVRIIKSSSILFKLAAVTKMMLIRIFLIPQEIPTPRLSRLDEIVKPKMSSQAIKPPHVVQFAINVCGVEIKVQVHEKNSTNDSLFWIVYKENFSTRSHILSYK
ncbi:hypothetical protein KCTCHS21_40080 [Cohnella abietis]|uniref:Uncharacterized protein n=1 Tax=Cohnella abietis TaxID=2507935 RepID=A0A3T1D960_9BACL|nr:hypothetical protein KCTCHS21_40080 [Cohnella abietis]